MFLPGFKRGYAPLVDLLFCDLQCYLTQLSHKPIILAVWLFHLNEHLYQTLISYFQIPKDPYVFPYLILISTIHVFCISVHQFVWRILNLADISNFNSPTTLYYTLPIVQRFRLLGLSFHVLIFLMPLLQLSDLPIGWLPQNSAFPIIALFSTELLKPY